MDTNRPDDHDEDDQARNPKSTWLQGFDLAEWQIGAVEGSRHHYLINNSPMRRVPIAHANGNAM